MLNLKPYLTKTTIIMAILVIAILVLVAGLVCNKPVKKFDYTEVNKLREENKATIAQLDSVKKANLCLLDTLAVTKQESENLRLKYVQAELSNQRVIQQLNIKKDEKEKRINNSNFDADSIRKLLSEGE